MSVNINNADLSQPDQLLYSTLYQSELAEAIRVSAADQRVGIVASKAQIAASAQGSRNNPIVLTNDEPLAAVENTSTCNRANEHEETSNATIPAHTEQSEIVEKPVSSSSSSSSSGLFPPLGSDLIRVSKSVASLSLPESIQAILREFSKVEVLADMPRPLCQIIAEYAEKDEEHEEVPSVANTNRHDFSEEVNDNRLISHRRKNLNDVVEYYQQAEEFEYPADAHPNLVGFSKEEEFRELGNFDSRGNPNEAHISHQGELENLDLDSHQNHKPQCW